MRRNFMPLYIPDFIADTVHLSAAETGAYICLIMDYWLHDGLPDDNRKLAQIARLPLRSWCMMRPTMQAFFHDGWRHTRIDKELDKMVRLSEQRKAVASKAGTQAAINRQSCTGNSTKRDFSKNFSKNSRKVLGEHYTTQERITSTCSVAARARASPAENPANSSNGENQRQKSVQNLSTELQSTLTEKGWLR